MKKFIIPLILIVLIVGTIISPVGASTKKQIDLALTPCEAPITYKIDEVDPQFHLTKEEFTQKVQEGADIWNNAYHKELFVYDPNGKISINLTFDGRQAINEEVHSLEEGVTSEKDTLTARQKEYEQRVQRFEARVSKLNSDIQGWNERGGAPEDEFQRLTKEQNELRQEAAELNDLARTLNESTASFNSQVRELNQSIDAFNEVLHEKPEEGVYSEGDMRIDIFFNTNDNTLTRTIAHELGHARGLDHVANRSGVMYEKTFPEYTLTEDDIKELEKACEKRSFQEALKESIRSTILDLRRSVYHNS